MQLPSCLYFAPMEGITGSIYRCAHQRIFGYADRYYAPFIFTDPGGKINKKDWMEIAPEYNEGCQVVPQLLSNCAKDFIATARTLKGMGYQEVNLNLGCPSQTVASKGRGSGFLGDPQALEIFLDKVFDGLDMKISMKTRIGLHDPAEFDELLKLYERFPIEELIVHPRVRGDFYRGTPNQEAFEKAVRKLQIPICYNGDLFTVNDFGQMQKKYLQIHHWMFGRGLLSNPALCREIKGGAPASREELADFYHEILEGYNSRMDGNKKVIFLMKEFLRYIASILSQEDRQAVNRLLHTDDRTEFLKKADELLEQCTIMKGQGYSGI